VSTLLPASTTVVELLALAKNRRPHQQPHTSNGTGSGHEVQRNERTDAKLDRRSPVRGAQGIDRAHSTPPATRPATTSGRSGEECAFVHSCSTHGTGTLLPGYVSRPNPSPNNRLELPMLRRSSSTADRCRRALSFADSLQGSPEGMALHGVNVPTDPSPHMPSGSVAPTHGFEMRGYGAVDGADAPTPQVPMASDTQVGKMSGANAMRYLKSTPVSQSFSQASRSLVAELHVELGTCALQHLPKGTEGEAHATAAERSNSLASCQEHAGSSTAPRNSAHDQARHAGAFQQMGPCVSKAMERRFCRMPLPRSVTPYRQLYCILCELHRWLQAQHVQVRCHMPRLQAVRWHAEYRVLRLFLVACAAVRLMCVNSLTMPISGLQMPMVARRM
jgi:hypothetical protein